MQFYSTLPRINSNFLIETSVNSLRRLRKPKQGFLNHSILARMEVVRLAVFSAMELSVHIVMTLIKFSAAVILYPRFQVNEWIIVLDIFAHIVCTTRLARAILPGLVLGLIQPEWSVELYQRLSLVKEPKGRFAKMVDRVESALKWYILTVGGCSLALATGSLIKLFNPSHWHPGPAPFVYDKVFFAKLFIGSITVWAATHAIFKLCGDRLERPSPKPEPTVDERKLAIQMGSGPFRVNETSQLFKTPCKECYHGFLQAAENQELLPADRARAAWTILSNENVGNSEYWFSAIQHLHRKNLSQQEFETFIGIFFVRPEPYDGAKLREAAALRLLIENVEQLGPRIEV